MNTETSARLFEEAQRYIPGGVNSPVRAMKSVGMPHPLFIDRARGAHIWDADGNEFVDFVVVVGAHDPRLGPPGRRRPPARPDRPRHQLRRADRARGRAGAPHLRGRAVGRDGAHGQLGHRGDDERRARRPRLHRAREDRQVHRLLPRPLRRVPGGRRQRRAHARAARQPRRHQGHDRRHAAGRVQRRRGADARCSPSAARRSPRSSSSRWPATWASCRREPGFLEACRELCTRHGAVLIFDEVITGFRVAWGGAQERFGVLPDLTTLGKIIGGGLPVGAFGGRREIMETVAPLGSHLPGGHAVRQSAGDGRRRGHAARPQRSRASTSGSRRWPHDVAAGLHAAASRRRSPVHAQPGRPDDDALLLRGPGAQLRRRQAGRHRAASPPTGGTCSRAASTWRRRSSRRP